MVHSHKVVSSPATCGSEARPDGAGRLPLRAIKIVVWNVGGMAAAADFIIACKSDGMIDILVLVEAKVQDLDRARALIEMMFPGAGIQIVGVPCERNLDVAAGMLRQNVYGGIVAVIFNRGIHAQPRSPRDGVVAFECTTRGMRPIDIIAVYLPPRPDAGKDQRRFLSAGQRLEHMVLEYNAARRKQHRVIIVGDFNAHIGNCDGHFCVRKDVSPIEQRLQLLDAFSACGVSPLHGRLKDAPAYPTSYSQQHTVDGVKLARREGRHPGAESDYIAGDVLWLEGREFTLFARNDLTVPYFGGPLPVNEQYHPKGPPRHDLLAANITLEEEQQPQAEAPAQRQKQQKVAAYGDGGAWHEASQQAEPALDAWLTSGLALHAAGSLDTPAAMDSFVDGFTAVTSAVMGALAGHSRDCPPGHEPQQRSRGSHCAPALARARVGLKLRQRDRARLTAQLRRGDDGMVVASAHNERVLVQLEAVVADIRARLQMHKRLIRAELRRIICVRARREEALLRWDAHTAAVNLRRNNDGSFILRGKTVIPQAGGVPAATRFHGHIAKLLQRPAGPTVPALLMLASLHAAGVAAASPPVHLAGALPPVQWYDATAAHGAAADWAQYWEVRSSSLEKAKEGIRSRVHDEIARLDVENGRAFLHIWSAPEPSAVFETAATFQSRAASLQALSAALRARQGACILDGERRCRELDDAHWLDVAEQASHRHCHACPELYGAGRHLYAALRDCCPAPAAINEDTAAKRAIGLAAPRRDTAPPLGPLNVPHAEGGYLQRDVTSHDVYAVLFPPAKQMPYCCITGCSPTPGTTSACPSCAKFNADLEAWKPEDIRSEAPEFPTQLRTGKASGVGGAVAEVFCWLRPLEEGLRLQFRLKICKVLALYFSSFLRQGKVPASFKEGLCTAILKSVKSGRVDAADPDYYRFITVAGIMPKLFGCVLLTRLSHWSDRTGVTSDSQNAFRADRNCEQHVISLIELLRARQRGGRSTWMLFVDFRKAYDSVDQAALWEVLRLAGVPPAIVALLREWNAGRTAKLSINGEVTDPFDITIGVPQGDVLSPWLFNLFVESLIRTIRADPVFTGVCEFGITIKELMYADDLSMPCTSRLQVQRALEIVTQWCCTWGMRINTGTGKTEVLVFGEEPPPGGWQPVRAGGISVSVGAEYRYLGLEVNTRLEYEPLIARYASKMWSNYNRFFRSNAYVRHMSLRAQAIQLRTFVLSAATFLAAALPAHTPALAAVMDKRLLDMLASLLRLDRNVPHGALLLDGNTPSTLHTWVRERTRVYLEALSPATHNPRILLHRILLRQTAPAFRHPDTFVAQTERMFADHGFLPQACQHCHGPHAGLCVATVTGSEAPSSKEIKSHARAMARFIATTQWALHAKAGLSEWNPDRWLDRPAAGQAELRFWMCCGFALPDLLAWAGEHKHCPFSLAVPGGSGSVICNAEITVAMATVLLQAREGSSAHRYRKDDGTFACPTSCAACNAPVGDPYHFLFECSHATCRAAQRRVQYLLRGCVGGIVARARDIAKHRKVPEIASKPMLDCADAVDAALRQMDEAQWASPAGRSTLARLSYVQPWSARNLPASVLVGMEAAQRLAAALGRLFDSINWPACLTRDLCTQWAFKASKAHRIGNESRDATHPDVPAHRRGGAVIFNAAAGERQDLAAEAEAAADAAAAAAFVAARGRIPVPPLVPRRSGRRRAAPLARDQRTITEFYSDT